MTKEKVSEVKGNYETMIKNLLKEIERCKQEIAGYQLEQDRLIRENGTIRSEWRTALAARQGVEHENELLKSANKHFEETLNPYFVSCSYNHGNKRCLIDRMRLYDEKLDLELKNEAYRIVVADLMEKRKLPKVTPQPGREFVKTLNCSCGKATPLRADEEAICAYCGEPFMRMRR